MKIKKNLSDAEMLKAFNENTSFENEYAPDINSKPQKNKPDVKKTNAFLPEEIEEKFSQLILELRAELLKDSKTNVQWKVKKENNQIIIYYKDK